MSCRRPDELRELGVGERATVERRRRRLGRQRARRDVLARADRKRDDHRQAPHGRMRPAPLHPARLRRARDADKPALPNMTHLSSAVGTRFRSPSTGLGWWALDLLLLEDDVATADALRAG